MTTESHHSYRSRKGGGRRSSSSRGSGSRSGRRSESGAGQRNARVRNPAGFELLGIGLAFGLCVGFVLGLGFNRMTSPGSVLSRGSSPAPKSVVSEASGQKQDAQSVGLTAEERKRKEIQTQQRLADWEKETFQIDEGKVKSPGEDQRKAWAIIDGLEEVIDE